MIRRFFAAVSAGTMLHAVPAHAEWLEARSPHFIVYADMSDKDLRERIGRLEEFDGALRGLFKPQSEDRATIYVLGSTSEIQRLAGNSRVAGFYSSSTQGSQGFVPERLSFEMPGMSAESVLFHEYTHHMLLTNLEENFPGWVHEGMAELFMTARFTPGGDVIIGAPNESRGWAMNGLSRWTVRRLIESDEKPPKGDEIIERYSRGWAVIHYLLISGKRDGQFFKYINALNAGTPAIKAAKAAFGDLDKLDSEVNAYLRARRFPTKIIPARNRIAPGQIEVSSLTAGQREILPFRIRSANGVGPDTAAPLAAQARSAAAAFPSDPFVQRTMTEIEFDAAAVASRKSGTAVAGAYALADAAADRALAVDPNNTMAMIYKGRIAAMLAASGDKAKWNDARKWFLAANKADPNSALAFQLYYETFLASGVSPPDSAVTGMRRAVVLAPADLRLRSQLAIELVRRGELGDAERVLRAVAFNPHSKPDNGFVTLLRAIEGGAPKDKLAAQIKELKFDRMTEFTLAKPDADDGGEPS
jgi:hypothetical protein